MDPSVEYECIMTVFTLSLWTAQVRAISINSIKGSFPKLVTIESDFVTFRKVGCCWLSFCNYCYQEIKHFFVPILRGRRIYLFATLGYVVKRLSLEELFHIFYLCVSSLVKFVT